METQKQDILAIVQARRAAIAAEQARELNTRINAENTQQIADFPQKAREVYKEGNSEIGKHCSRSSEEPSEFVFQTSSEKKSATPEQPSQPNAAATEGLIENHFDYGGDATTVTSRTETYSGISVQHVITKAGIKVSITLQSYEDAELGAQVQVTAELKRSDRLRELKPYDGDDDWFAEVYAEQIEDIKLEKDKEHKKLLCIGRMHERGKRAAWYKNMLAIGKLNADNEIETLILCIEGESYQVNLTKENMSTRQLDAYHCIGFYGALKKNKAAPSIANAPRTLYKG
jgi:hypothetical protein